jgi:small-conductance mechanosensitive channel
MEDGLDTRAVDARLEDIEVEIQLRGSRVEDLLERKALFEAAVEKDREMLEEARLVSLKEGPDAPEPVTPEPTPAAPLDPDLVGPLPAPEEPPTPDEMPQLSPAERELLRLEDSLPRFELQLLERRGGLDRKQVELVSLAIELQSLKLPLLVHYKKRWSVRRDELAAREGDGIFSATRGLLDPSALAAGAEYAQLLIADPTATLEEVRARIAQARRPSQEMTPGLLFALSLLGLLVLILGLRALPILARARAEGWADQLALAAAEAIAPVLPVTLVCGALLTFDAIPDPLRPFYRFSALAPPLVGVVIAWAGVLFPKGGSESMSPSVARYLRGLVRVGAAFGAAIGAGAAMLPLLGFPSAVGQLLQAALVLWLLLGWLGILLRRAELLALLGADGDISEVGVLRVGIRRFYRVFVLGPVVIYVLYAMGYVNLARLLVRGGLVTLGVALAAPWVYHRATGGLRRVIGYPNGGGWLALSPDGARSAYRALVPLVLLFVGGGSAGLLASGWDYSGNVFTNLTSALTAPLFEIGGSRITGLSIVLFACTIVVTILVSRWVESLLGRNLYPLYDLDTGRRAMIDTLGRYVIFGLGLVIALDVIGVGIGFLTVFAGVIGLAVGFGGQTLAANFISGLILLVGRRVSVDDVIEIDGVVGRVTRISAYATLIKTIDNLLVVIPNSKLIDTVVVNWTEEDVTVRIPVAVGVAYGSDVPLVRRLMLQAGVEDPRVRLRPQPLVRFDDFGDSSLLFTLNAWIDDPDLRMVVASDLRIRIDRLFRANDVEIAFPQRDLRLRTGDATLKVALEHGFEVRQPDGTVISAAGSADKKRG